MFETFCGIVTSLLLATVHSAVVCGGDGNWKCVTVTRRMLVDELLGKGVSGVDEKCYSVECVAENAAVYSDVAEWWEWMKCVVQWCV